MKMKRKILGADGKEMYQFMWMCIVQETHRQIATQMARCWCVSVSSSFSNCDLLCLYVECHKSTNTHSCAVHMCIALHSWTHEHTNKPCLELQTTMISQTHWGRCAHNYVTRASIGETLAFVQHTKHWNPSGIELKQRNQRSMVEKEWKTTTTASTNKYSLVFGSIYIYATYVQCSYMCTYIVCDDINRIDDRRCRDVLSVARRTKSRSRAHPLTTIKKHT